MSVHEVTQGMFGFNRDKEGARETYYRIARLVFCTAILYAGLAIGFGIPVATAGTVWLIPTFILVFVSGTAFGMGLGAPN